MVKGVLQLAVYDALQRADLTGDNFLENIEWILENVTEENFEEFGCLALPVGRLSPGVSERLGVEEGRVYLKVRIYARLKDWWDILPGHPELGTVYYQLLPSAINSPTQVLEDKHHQDTYLLVTKLHKVWLVVIELVQERERLEIKTIFLIDMNRVEKEYEVLWETEDKKALLGGLADPSVLAHHVINRRFKRGVAGARFPSLQESLRKDPSKDLPKSQVRVTDVELEHPADFSHGDYSTNIALQLASQSKQNPRELAQKIVDNLEKPDLADKIEIAGPGFINFWLSREWLLETAAGFTSTEGIQRTVLSSRASDRGKAVIDYSSPNIARRFSVGHLRSTVIGQSLYNIYEALGWEVIGDNHLGDWGTQFGKLIYAIQKWSSMEKLADSKDRIDRLQSLYVKFHQKVKNDPRLEKEGREWFKKLEKGDRQARRMWKQLVEWSIEEYARIYELLDVEIDYAYGESFYEDKMPAIIQEAKDKGITSRSEGAWVVDVGEDIPPGMLVKSDGATTYFTRDLATVKFRLEKWDPSLIIYEVGKEQQLHFKQVFRAVEKFGWKEDLQLIHVAHGHVRLPEGAISTRKGRVVLLEDILKQAIERAQTFLEEPDEELAKKIGIGAVKYNDLKQQPHKDVLFDWDRVLNLEGNSGPYLQYTHARCKSVLREADKKFVQTTLAAVSVVCNNNLTEVNKEEEALLRTFYQFPEVVQTTAAEFAPNKICDFLFDLAQKYNTFYQKHRILDAPEGKEIVPLRLTLTAATAQVLSQGLKLLGIAAPEKM